MNKNLVIGVFLGIAIVLGLTIVSAPAGNWVLDGDSVYVNDSNVYISVSPHTLQHSGDITIDLRSKVYSGDIDVLFGFDSSHALPSNARLYNPHNVTETHSYTCSDPNWYNYTATHFWCWANVSNNETNSTETVLVYDHDYDWANLSTDTAYWNTTHEEYWSDFADAFTQIDYDFGGMDTWYYASGLTIQEDVNYTMKTNINVTLNSTGKYWFAIKPSGESLSEAIANEHLYYLDPWWNSSWEMKKPINISSDTAVNDYQIALNITYDSDMQNGFDDLRFMNEEEDTELDYWIEDKSNGNWAYVWVEIDSIDTDNGTQAYMYYNNSGASSESNGDNTFIIFEDFSDDPFTDTSNFVYKNVTEQDWEGVYMQTDFKVTGREDGMYGGGLTLLIGNVSEALDGDYYKSNIRTVLTSRNVESRDYINRYLDIRNSSGLSDLLKQYEDETIDSWYVAKLKVLNDSKEFKTYYRTNNSLFESNTSNSREFSYIPKIDYYGIYAGISMVSNGLDSGTYCVNSSNSGGWIKGCFDNLFAKNQLYNEPTITLGSEETANAAPNAPTVNSPSDGATGQALSVDLNVTVTDDDGDTMNVSFYNNATDAQIGSTQTGVANGSTAEVTWSGLSAGTTYYWYANSTDGSAITQSSVWNFTTSQTPTIDNIDIFPDTAYTDDGLTVNLTASDSDSGETITYYCDIYKDGALQSSPSSTISNNTETSITTIASGDTAKGEVWEANCTIGDGISNSSVSSDSVTISNTAPTLDAYDTNPTDPTTSENIYFNITCSDLDADTLTGYVNVYINGVLNDSNSSTVTDSTNSLIYTLDSSNTTFSDNITGEYWCGDGTANTSQSNDTVTVQANTPPNYTLNAPINGAVNVSTNATLNITALDDDGDSMNISFYEVLNNSLIYPSGTIETAPVNLSILSSGFLQRNLYIRKSTNLSNSTLSFTGLDTTRGQSESTDDMVASHDVASDATAYGNDYFVLSADGIGSDTIFRYNLDGSYVTSYSVTTGYDGICYGSGYFWLYDDDVTMNRFNTGLIDTGADITLNETCGGNCVATERYGNTFYILNETGVCVYAISGASASKTGYYNIGYEGGGISYYKGNILINNRTGNEEGKIVNIYNSSFDLVDTFNIGVAYAVGDSQLRSFATNGVDYINILDPYNTREKIYQISLVSTYLVNPELRIGSDDASASWDYTGNFSVTESTSDLSSTIETYLASCTANTEGYCEVPLYFSSDTAAKMTLNSINLEALLGSNTSVANGTEVTASFNNLLDLLIYEWYATITDGTNTTTTSTYNFTTRDDTPPIVTATYQSDSSVYQGIPITWNCTATDVSSTIDTVWASITYPGGSVVNRTMSGSNPYTYTWNVPTDAALGTYLVDFYANDTYSNEGVSGSGYSFTVNAASGSGGTGTSGGGGGGGTIPMTFDNDTSSLNAELSLFEDYFIYSPFGETPIKKWTKEIRFDAAVSECSSENPDWRCYIGNDTAYIQYTKKDDSGEFIDETRTSFLFRGELGRQEYVDVGLRVINLGAYIQIAPLKNSSYPNLLFKTDNNDTVGIRVWWIYTIIGILIMLVAVYFWRLRGLK